MFRLYFLPGGRRDHVSLWDGADRHIPEPSGEQYDAKTLVNVAAMTVPIEVIGQLIGEDLGLEFNDDLPSDFWDDLYPCGL